MGQWDDLWNELNQRQQTYLQIIYDYDQAQERNERWRAMRTKRSHPADRWRWIEYSGKEDYATPLKRAIKQVELVDPGTGSTFKALEERGYLLVKSRRATADPRSDVIVWVRMTTKGRKLVRQALDIQAPVRLSVGDLRSWHWRALSIAYKAGEIGVQEWPKEIGNRTIERLKRYQAKGEKKSLIASQAITGVPYLRRRWPGDEGELTTTHWRLCITEFGKYYYRENWQRYHEMYPDIDAPEPEA